MRYFELKGLRALFQTVCFGFIGAVALGSHIFGYPTSEIRDTGGISQDVITSVKDTTNKADTPEISQSFKTANGFAYSAPVTAASTPVSGPKTLYFNQPISYMGTDAQCAAHDAKNGIIHCTYNNGDNKLHELYYAHRVGAFAQLSSANAGDYIVIDGQTFHVEAIKYHPANMKSIESIVYANYSAVLMTCAGPNNSERLVIYANRV